MFIPDYSPRMGSGFLLRECVKLNNWRLLVAVISPVVKRLCIFSNRKDNHLNLPRGHIFWTRKRQLFFKIHLNPSI